MRLEKMRVTRKGNERRACEKLTWGCLLGFEFWCFVFAIPLNPKSLPLWYFALRRDLGFVQTKIPTVTETVLLVAWFWVQSFWFWVQSLSPYLGPKSSSYRADNEIVESTFQKRCSMSQSLSGILGCLYSIANEPPPGLKALILLIIWFP